MKWLRVLVTLLMLASAITPSLAAVCASSCAVGCEDMAGMKATDMSQDPSGVTMNCHEDGGQTQQGDSAHETCPMAAVCTLAVASPLSYGRHVIHHTPSTGFFPEAQTRLSSLPLPPPIEPPIV